MGRPSRAAQLALRTGGWQVLRRARAGSTPAAASAALLTAGPKAGGVPTSQRRTLRPREVLERHSELGLEPRPRCPPGLAGTASQTEGVRPLGRGAGRGRGGSAGAGLGLCSPHPSPCPPGSSTSASPVHAGKTSLQGHPGLKALGTREPGHGGQRGTLRTADRPPSCAF